MKNQKTTFMRNMKKHIPHFFLLALFVFSSCELTEEPPYLTSETIYSNSDNAEAALNGIYHAWADWGTFRYFFPKALNFNSGFYMSRDWQSADLLSLSPLQGNFIVNIVWTGHYNAIARANDVIAGVSTEEVDETIQDIVGQAYFLRAFGHFNLVRLYGDVPLRISPVDSETLYLGKEDSKVIFDQIVSDAKEAIANMNGAMGDGYPRQYAACMLLAKVYMHLATNPELQSESADYWQLAYDEAKKVYGNYSLVGDYAELFDGRTNENTEESIFEVQFNGTIRSDLFRDWSISNYGAFPGWMGLRVNPEVYDRHLGAYPTDTERLGSTFLTEYERINGGTSSHYPVYNDGIRDGSNYNQSFTLPFKTSLKDKSATNNISPRNTIVYRYADLLLMLAEISNELQNGEELGYVTEVLARVGITPRAEYSGGQVAFREAIMEEYNYELLTEGHDWFNNRRRGYSWFMDHVINPHNNYSKKNPLDAVFATDEATVMHLPIPAAEIGSNPSID
jgi:hypothetical protein